MFKIVQVDRPDNFAKVRPVKVMTRLPRLHPCRRARAKASPGRSVSRTLQRNVVRTTPQDMLVLVASARSLGLLISELMRPARSTTWRQHLRPNWTIADVAKGAADRAGVGIDEAFAVVWPATSASQRSKERRPHVD